MNKITKRNKKNRREIKIKIKRKAYNQPGDATLENWNLDE
jgi:hypothetical protein